MNSKIDHDNPLTKRAVAWKRKQAIISLPIEEMEKKIGADAVIEQKVDGQSVIMDHSEEINRFATLDGRIIEDLPVLDEIRAHLGFNRGITKAQMMGELAAMEDGKILGFNESMSIIRNPDSDKDKISWHPYQILSMEGEELSDDPKSYKVQWQEIEHLFKGAKHIKPVVYAEGGKDELLRMWKQLVLDQSDEGLVIRTADGKIYKSKPRFAYDLVIVAVGDKTGKNWPKKMIGTTLMAFMDKNGVFRTAGEVASGFSQAERAELFSWAQKNKIDRKSVV